MSAAKAVGATERLQLEQNSQGSPSRRIGVAIPLPGSAPGEAQCPTSFIIRYGDVWTDWRETTSRANADKEITLELDKDKDIENISGYSYDKSGTTCSLQAKSSAGYFSKLLSSNSWGPHGDHTSSPGRSLRSSPDPPSNGLRLNHCSGSTTENKYILR